MSAWDQAIKFVLDYEGGYVNNPADPGGETFRGISRKNWPLWAGWPHVDNVRNSPDFPNLLMADEKLTQLVMDFYREVFWNAIHGDELPDHWAIATFDCAVNQGIKRAIRLMQVAVNIEADGVVGPVTVSAVHKANHSRLEKLLALRAVEYVHLILEKPALGVWGFNWMLRLFRLSELVLKEDPQNG